MSGDEPSGKCQAKEGLNQSTSSHMYRTVTSRTLLACSPSYILQIANGRFCPAANGVAGASPPTRASPAPQVPNGKPPPVPQPLDSQVIESNTKSAAPIVPTVNDNRNIVRRKLTGYVGFANLPNQWHRKSVRKGFNFNVMVVGELQSMESAGGDQYQARLLIQHHAR